MSTSDQAHEAESAKGKRGSWLQQLSPEERKEFARRGARAAHASNNARRWTTEEAREAGRKGGKKTSKRRDHMAAIGRKGGLAKTKRNSTTPPQAEQEEWP